MFSKRGVEGWREAEKRRQVETAVKESRHRGTRCDGRSREGRGWSPVRCTDGLEMDEKLPTRWWERNRCLRCYGHRRRHARHDTHDMKRSKTYENVQLFSWLLSIDNAASTGQDSLLPPWSDTKRLERDEREGGRRTFPSICKAGLIKAGVGS